MIWLNPWAWLGLLTLAVPILVHLLARQRAPVQRFPSLRFLAGTRLLTVDRARPTDLALLALRLAILAVAVAALAQPYFQAEERAAWQTRTGARAVVVDTSASMRRSAASGERLVDVALAEGRAAIEASATAEAPAAGLVIATAAPAAALSGAAAWLGGQPGVGELVVISDFQLGALDTMDLAAVPAHVGLDLRRAPAASADPVTEWSSAYDTGTLTTRVAPTADGTDAVWTWGPAPPAGSTEEGVLLLHAPGDTALADALYRAASASAGAPSGRGARPIAVILPGHEEAGALLESPRAIDAPWMGDVVAALSRDATLAAAAAEAPEPAGQPPAAAFPVVARTRGGEAAVLATRARIGGVERLALVVRTDPGGLISAAVLAGTLRAVVPGSGVAELEPRTLPDSVLARWRRPAMPPPAAAAAVPPGASDGRWLWAVVLLLLGAETVLRRRRPAVVVGGDG